MSKKKYLKYKLQKLQFTEKTEMSRKMKLI